MAASGPMPAGVIGAVICVGLVVATISNAKKAYGVPTNPALVDGAIVLIPYCDRAVLRGGHECSPNPNKPEAQGSDRC